MQSAVFAAFSDRDTAMSLPSARHEPVDGVVPLGFMVFGSTMTRDDAGRVVGEHRDHGLLLWRLVVEGENPAADGLEAVIRTGGRGNLCEQLLVNGLALRQGSR